MIVEVPVIRDASHSTESTKIEGAVYEVVFQTDEMYWHLGMFESEALAKLVAARGNTFVDRDPVNSRGIGFEIREHGLIRAIYRDWSRQDFIEELDGWDIEDWFLPEPDPEEPA